MNRALLLSGILALPSISLAQEKPVTAEPGGKIFRPAELKPTPERQAKLKLPPGFALSVFAENLGKPRMLAVAACCFFCRKFRTAKSASRMSLRTAPTSILRRTQCA